LDTKIRHLLQDLRQALESLYGDRLKGLYLYGSYARGDYDEESDVDVLIVLDDFTSYGTEVDRASALVAEISLKYALSISQVHLRERQWLHGDSPFLRNVRDEATAA